MRNAVPRSWSILSDGRACCRRAAALIAFAVLAGDSTPIVLAASEDIRTAETSNVSVAIEGGVLGKRFTDEAGETRILLLRVSVGNNGDAPLNAAPAMWRLQADEIELQPGSVPNEIATETFTVADQSIALQDAQTRVLNIKPGDSVSTWLTFLGLPGGNHVPRMRITLTRDDIELMQIDINEVFDQKLKMSVERVGPADAVAMLKIAGRLDTVNLGSVISAIDKVAADRVARFVVGFSESAFAPDRDVAGYLRRVAIQSGRASSEEERFPPLPTGVVDFHYVDFQPVKRPSSNDDLPEEGLDVSWSGQSHNVHQSVVAAVDSAIAPLCDSLPREHLVECIRHGDEYSSAAVLRHSGERLTASELPLILSLTEHKSPLVATAAVDSLRSFRQAQALNQLIALARGSLDGATRSKVREAAVRSLAGSRYAEAHQKLIELLDDDDAELRGLIVEAMEAEPRPVWVEPLSRLFRAAGESDRVQVLSALAVHSPPELVGLLEESLHSENAQLSSAALDILISQSGPQAEQVTSQWLNRRLETSPPSPRLHRYLRQTRDQSCVPHLMRYLSEKTVDRRELLLTILAIGDQQVVEQVATQADDYKPDEKLLVLRALLSVRSDGFWNRASEIVESAPTGAASLEIGLLGLLQSEASDRAVSLIAELLDRVRTDEARHDRVIASACAGLSAIGTPSARIALRKVRDEGEAGAEVARESLRKLYQRSPAMRYVDQGVSLLQRRENPAAALIAFDAAVETDPELPVARQQRGNVFFRLPRISRDQLQTARDDFAKLLELEPGDSEGYTGLALALVRLGSVERGLTGVTEVKEQFADDPVFLYNVACVFGRAIEQLKASPDWPNSELQERVARLRVDGIDFLRQSIKHGLDDDNFEWMRNDPDLVTIRESEKFQEMLGEAANRISRAPVE